LRSGVLASYRNYLPVTDLTPMISMGEGGTPLIRARWLETELGIAEVYLKFEGLNPTGSFKDRGMVVAVAKAVERGARTVMCASTGNTAASAAAYAGRAGVACFIVAPRGGVASAKLGQARAHGAKVLVIEGNFDQGLEIVREMAEYHPIAVVNSINPHRISGQMTAAYEVCDDLGRAPGRLFIPVGNAGNITAYWRGFKRYFEDGTSSSLPKMMGFQAEGAAPIVKGSPVEKPETRASAIRIGNPASWQYAVAARDESGGIISTVSDDEMMSARALIAAHEGVFCELASAASVAGLIKTAQAGQLESAETAVCVLTGHGLKDCADNPVGSQQDLCCAANLEAAEEVLGLKRTK
jgi:threonine synthase